MKVNNYELKRKNFPTFLNKGQKYYYTDEKNVEWEFKEKAGTINHFYFACSITKCNGFVMISRNDKEKKFILTKKHNCSYISHSYNNPNNTDKIYKDNRFEQKDWDEKDFRRNYINWYFNNNEINEAACLEFIKGKLNNKINIMEDILKKEIKSVRICLNLKNKAKQKVIEDLINMKDKYNENICTNYEYDDVNNKINEATRKNLFLIINKEMALNLSNSNIRQFFGDATYHCIPPTVKKFKLFIISGFDLKNKKQIYVVMLLYLTKSIVLIIFVLNYLLLIFVNHYHKP